MLFEYRNIIMKNFAIFFCIILSSCSIVNNLDRNNMPPELFKKIIPEDGLHEDEFSGYLAYIYTGPFPEDYSAFAPEGGFYPKANMSDINDAPKRIKNTKRNRGVLYQLVVNEENTDKLVKYNNQYSYLWYYNTYVTYKDKSNRRDELTEEMIDLAKKYGKTEIVYRWLCWDFPKESKQAERYRILNSIETKSYKNFLKEMGRANLTIPKATLR